MMDNGEHSIIQAIAPPYLKKGDKVAITCPAKKLPKPMTDAIELLQSWGLEVVLGETLGLSFHQFAGDDDQRAQDLQRFIDDDSIKAIIAARGGYGTIRMIDKVVFSRLTQNPKWLVGFSDITVLHTHLFNNFNIQSIHGQMPVNIADASSKSLESLRKALFGEEISYKFNSNALNRSGEAEGILIGGNLSLLADYDNKILFIEDVGEYLYAVDRMIRMLDRASKLKKLNGLIVGGFTEIKDNDIPFGQTIEQIIMEVVGKYTYPVCFDFPAGHVPDNRSILLGRQCFLNIAAHQCTITY